MNVLILCLNVILFLAVGDGAFAFQTSHSSGGGATRLSSSTQLHGVGAALLRARDSLLDRERSREDLKIGIAGFYDRSSKLWEDVWGEVRSKTRRSTFSVFGSVCRTFF